jgi:tRNA C32,U32 (ribose-2'-O)-methylase TrmJ
MATTIPHTTELAMKLRLSKQASEKHAPRAAESGQDVAAVASELIEQAVTRPTVDEALASFRKQVAESGMSDEELDDFFRGEIEAHRRERKAKSA